MKITRRDLAFLTTVAVVGAVMAASWLRRDRASTATAVEATAIQADELLAVDALNAALAAEWDAQGLAAMAPAPPIKVARRVSLALAGTVPSIEEIRLLERQAPDDQLAWWLSQVLASQRSNDYLAERFARAFVGVDQGPFLIFRRRRFTNWLSQQFRENRPYDELVRDLLAGDGIWTTNPAVNFITATVDQNEDKGPDEVRLAGRLTRAFLGVRMDCMQCHDGIDSDWKQSHFHEMAAFFHDAELSLSGVRDKESEGYQFTYHGEKETETVPTAVPFHQELLPEDGAPRQRLALWVTHPENEVFARATVNRVWALMFGRPLVEPVDNLPVDGPWPTALTVLAEDFSQHGFDLRRLIRVIALSDAFQVDSAAPAGAAPPTAAHEAAWAAFPATRLRPDQIAGSLIQATSLKTIDAETHILLKLGRFSSQNEFVKRYGDVGEDEFDARAGTIPQRLLMMNGNLVTDRIKDNLFVNAAPQLAVVAADKPTTIIETAYLGVFGRRPTASEASHFLATLDGHSQDGLKRAVADLFWTLMNTTEFAWNH